MEGIDGVILTPLKVMADERGKVMHMLRNDAPHFQAFGETYFSWVNPGVVKAWKLHSKCGANIAVPSGRVLFVLHDMREASSTRGTTQEVTLADAEGEYRLLTIPAGVAYGWKNLADVPSMLANCATEPFMPGEGKNLSMEEIAYDWASAHAIA